MALDAAQKEALKEIMDIPEFEDAIKTRLPGLLQAMFDLAEGVVHHEVKRDPDNGDWVSRCYSRDPERLAAQFLIENVIGKVPTRVEMTGKDGEAMKIVPWMPKLDAIEAEFIEPKEDEVRMLEEARDGAAK